MDSAVHAHGRTDAEQIAHELGTRFRNMRVRVASQHTASASASAATAQYKKKQIVHYCGCQGTLHPLYANCTACGLIKCIKDNPNQCQFCASIVTPHCTQMNETFFNKNAQDTHRKDEQRIQRGLENARAQRDRLLQYAVENRERANIIDEQADMFAFQANVWMDPQAKDEAEKSAQKQMEALTKRPQHYIAIDVDTRTVLTNMDAIAAKHGEAAKIRDGMKSITYRSSAEDFAKHALSSMQSDHTDDAKASYFYNDQLRGRALMVYENLKQAARNVKLLDDKQMEAAKKVPIPRNANCDDPASAIVIDSVQESMNEGEPVTLFQHVDQDENVETVCFRNDFQDEGAALSMWEPWASLACLGIKRFEGRTWYSSYRGPLWIMSASHELDPLDREQVETQYCDVYGNNANIPFPKQYTPSALLGCVDMVDCLSNSEFQAYREARIKLNEPIENSSSPYVFVFENPHVLTLPLRASGEHKIFKLTLNLWEAAKQQLRPVSQQWRTSLSGELSGTLDLYSGGRKFSKNRAGKKSESFISADELEPEQLSPTAFLCRQTISFEQQQKQIIDYARLVGIGTTGFLAVNAHIRAFWLGRHFNPLTQVFEVRRTDHDGALAPPLPKTMMSAIFASSKWTSPLNIPWLTPDVCQCLFLSITATNFALVRPCGLKQALSAIVVVGDSIDINVQSSNISRTVRLHSGDVMFFYQELLTVEKVVTNTMPVELNLRPGTLCCIFYRTA